MQKKKCCFPDDFGLKRSIIQKKKAKKGYTSIVALVFLIQYTFWPKKGIPSDQGYGGGVPPIFTTVIQKKNWPKNGIPTVGGTPSFHYRHSETFWPKKGISPDQGYGGGVTQFSLPSFRKHFGHKTVHLRWGVLRIFTTIIQKTFWPKNGIPPDQGYGIVVPYPQFSLPAFRKHFGQKAVYLLIKATVL